MGLQSVRHDWATESNPSLTNVSRIHCLLVNPHSTWALGGIRIQLFLSLKILFSLDLIHNKLFPVPLFYFIFCTPFQAFSICLPLSSISRGTCFVLCFPLHGFSYLIPWFWQPPANFWFPNPHLKSRSFTHIQIHLSPVSWVCQGSSDSACPWWNYYVSHLVQICFSFTVSPAQVEMLQLSSVSEVSIFFFKWQMVNILDVAGRLASIQLCLWGHRW